MPKSSSPESSFLGSSPKRTDEWPSKHHQTGRDAKGCMPEVRRNDNSFNSSSSRINGPNKSVIWARKEDDAAEAEAAGWPSWETDGKAKRVTGEGGVAIHDDGINGRRQSSSKINMEDKASSSKSACWDGPGDGNGKRETGGWSRWPAATPKTTNLQTNPSEGRTASEDGSTMACKRGWNESGDGREKREIGSDIFDHNGCDGRQQSCSNIHIVDRGALSMSASWDQGKYENVKRGNDGWHRWPGAMSKTTRQSFGHQNRKGCWTNESGDGKQKGKNGGDAFDHDCGDGWSQSGANIHIMDKRSLSKSASWDRAKDENAKRENDAWRGWPGVVSKTNKQCGSHQNRKGFCNQFEGWTTSENDCNMAGTRGWNVSRDGKGKRETADGGDSFDHDGHDGSRSSSSNIHMADKHSFSKSAPWDGANDDNTKSENDGWTRWPAALSKTIGPFSRHENKKLGWQSQVWTASDHGDSQKESGGRNPELVQSDDPWMQRGSAMSTKCDWNTSKCWNISKGDSTVRVKRKRYLGLDRTGGDPWKQSCPAEPSKANGRKFGSGAVAQGDDSIRMKSKWNDASDFSDPDGSKQSWGASMSSTSKQCPSIQNGGGWNQSWGSIASEDGDSQKQNNGRITDLDRSDDPWMKHRPMMLPKCDWKKSAGWNKSGGDDFEADHRRWGANSDQTGREPWEQLSPTEVPKFNNPIREKIKLSAAPDFGDPNAPKQNMHTFLPKIGGKMPFRGRNKTPYHPCEHEHYQSNDTYKKAGDVSAYYGNSPSAKSEKSNQVRYQLGGDAVPNHSDRDTDEFRDSKKTRFLRHDQGINFEDPWKQLSHNDGAEKSKLFQKDPSCDRFLRERGSHHDSFNDRGCHDRRDSVPYFASSVDPRRGNDVPSKDFSELDVQLSGDRWDQKNTGKASLSPWNVQKVSKAAVDNSHIQPHLRRDDEGFRDNNIKAMATTPEQNVDDNVTNSPHALKTSLKKLIPAVPAAAVPSDEILKTSTHFVKPEDNLTTPSCDLSKNSIEPVGVGANGRSNGSKNEKEEVGANGEDLKGGGMDDKGIRMFKFALAEFVKEIIKPVWKEGRLSKEAHKAVVKRVVDKVVAVLGANIPQTQERIDLYLSYAKDKLHKLVQDYLEMFINT